MNESDFNQALEALRERRLSEKEEFRVRALLVDDPEFSRVWQQEVSFNSILDQLPDVPVPSDFTALVLTAVDRPSPPPFPVSRLDFVAWLGRPWIRRLAAASVLILSLAAGWFHYNRLHRSHSSHHLVRLSSAASSVPEPELFKDFDAIRRLRHVAPPTDDALFDVLTQ